jgi:hypothetical protein
MRRRTDAEVRQRANRHRAVFRQFDTPHIALRTERHGNAAAIHHGDAVGDIDGDADVMGDAACYGLERRSLAGELTKPQASSITVLRRMPIFEISISSVSPLFIQVGGVWPIATPSGVPVAMMSPGTSGKASDT